MLKKLFSISEKEYGRFLILPIADGNFFRVSLLDLNKILNLDDKGEPIENYTRDLPPEKERNVTDPDFFDDIADGYYIYTTQTYDWDMDGRYGKFGIKDENGAIIVEEQYSDIYPSFAFGLCPVKNKDDKWGCVNKQGELVIPCSFYEPLLFSKYGIAEGEQGFVDVSGNYLEGIKYDCIDSYDEYDRYIKTAVLTPEQAESISDCGSAPGILEDIFHTKTRKYIAKGIPDGKISVYGDGDPETVVAAVDLLKEYDEVGVYDNCAIAIMGDERTVFRNEVVK